MTIARGPYDDIFDLTIDEATQNVWTGFHYDDWRDLEDTLSQTVAKAITPTDLEELNVAAQEWAQDNVGNLIIGIDKETRSAVQRLVARGLRHGWSDDELAQRLAKKVGLDGRFADAVENYRSALVGKGYPNGDASRMAGQYADQVRYARAKSIARTEVQKALIEGQRILWKEALEVGDLPRGVHRQWVLHPSEANCAVCKSMNGKTATITGHYRNGRSMPAHPNCRCHERLVTPEGMVVKIDMRALADHIIKRRLEKGKPNKKSTPREIVGHHGHHAHGTSILWPALYEHLRAKGYSKSKAARISNAAWNKKHGRGAKNVKSTRLS